MALLEDRAHLFFVYWREMAFLPAWVYMHATSKGEIDVTEILVADFVAFLKFRICFLVTQSLLLKTASRRCSKTQRLP